MRNIALFFAIFLFSITLANAQSNIKLSTSDGVDNEELMNVLRFQGISYSKVKFTGTHLWGKDFKLSISDYSNGKLLKTHDIFDSREDVFFKLKEQEFNFSVLAQRTNSGKAKFDFRFLGFGIVKEFNLNPNHKDFALKGFQSGDSEMPILINQDQSILTFIMPYKAKNGSMRYSDVIGSGVSPNELGKKFKIPRYFVINIRFD